MADDDAQASDSAGFGYGQQDPNDSADDFNAVTFLVRQFVAKLDTMKLVKVAAVKAGEGDVPVAGTVDVIPLVSQIDGQGTTTPHGTVFGIPWSRIQGGKNAVICDPQVGDLGYVVVADRDISAVKTAKKASPPGSRRSYNIADGVYAGGCLNVAPEQYLIFRTDGVRLVDKSSNSIVMTADGTVVTDSKGNVLTLNGDGITLTPATAKPVTVKGNLVVTGNLELEGNIVSETGGTYAGALKTSGDIIAGFGTGDQVALKTHTHTQANDSRGDTEQPTSAPTAGT